MNEVLEPPLREIVVVRRKGFERAAPTIANIFMAR
jgi:hypothetical protein